MEQKMYRPTWAEIDLEHIAYNIKEVQSILPTHTQIMAVVKANAYGHGAVEVAHKALQSGANALAVALLEEAIELREAGIVAPILVLGRTDPAYVEIASHHDITLTVFQKEWLEVASTCLKTGNLKIHLEIDTGMNRTGLKCKNELVLFLEELSQTKRIYLTGVYTHFASSDEADAQPMRMQQDKFEMLLKVLDENWEEPIEVHTANSAASIRCPNKMQHYIRFGVAMYGLYPSAYIQESTEVVLKPVMTLQTKLVAVKQIKAGESVSYGATFTAEQDMWLGTIPIGYADGWSRNLQGMTVLVNGEFRQIVGRICMDQCMIELDGPYPIGEAVMLIGRQKSAEITMEDVAKYLATINYEIPCQISARVPRVYVEKSK